MKNSVSCRVLLLRYVHHACDVTLALVEVIVDLANKHCQLYGLDNRVFTYERCSRTFALLLYHVSV